MDHWQAFMFLCVCQNIYRHCASKLRHTKQYICLVDFVVEMFFNLLCMPGLHLHGDCIYIKLKEHQSMLLSHYSALNIYQLPSVLHLQIALFISNKLQQRH